MVQQDYLLRQIQLMGIFLQKLISRMLKRNEDGDNGEIQEMVKTEFQNELGLNLDELAVIPPDDFFLILKEKKFTADLLEKLAWIFFLLGQTDGSELSVQKRNFLQKALDIYTKLEQESGSYSFERNRQIALIRQMQNM